MLALSAASHAQTASNTLPLPPQNSPSLADVSAPPRPKKRGIPPIGPEVGFSYFFDRKTRDRFGATAVRLSLGVGVPKPSFKGKLGADISFTMASHDFLGSRDRLTLISVGPEYSRAFIPGFVKRKIEAQRGAVSSGGAPSDGSAPPSGTPAPPNGTPAPPSGLPAGFSPPFLPYYGASLNVVYANVKVPAEGIRGSGLGGGGSVFFGVIFKRKVILESRVRASTNIKGLNFSGSSLSLGLRF